MALTTDFVNTGTLVVGGPQITQGVRKFLTGAQTLAPSDYLVGYSTLTGASVITGPANPVVGQTIVIKDFAGGASGTNTVTFTPQQGNIDGAANKVLINSAYGTAMVWFDGSNWFTIT